MAGTIRVAVAGAAGRMGRAAVRAVAAQEDMTLVAALGRSRAIGRDAGEVAGAGPLGVVITADLAQVLGRRPDVLVDFSPGPAAAEHARAALPAGVSPVIGGTGMAPADLQALADLAASHRTGAVVAPNFAVGAVLMIEFARRAARFFPHVEIIEMHHDRKRDAPSGTALRTAAAVAAARGTAPPPAVAEEEMVAGARGGRAEGIPVHSVRLPGLVAHQAVIFGGPGQTLTIRHDSISEESFMPGLLLAVRRVRSLQGLVHGLENLLDL
ncbi:MAG: 4-hydroxy-tetrahydrodipicolinate reductase [Armatimonadota bacterium]|nr:4-hydroxy-tetrahydrodipicolinate reductase [Armatimonadota bacterium]MDR7436649.1 4-hydroxy-tetrahydrodipicolinate reductase [Armatimonadota bacterium]MDR7472932.1 4-hydroxy-tetrahydrodipicolinate reductase [Armatimonadota bacterium]MDR7510346.1 4-hydroxy-tetrahydrodipicolinate reductase [Armatimonadota bacterium]MDR7516672.1 4-hydroxy-tetrahydrodipicolinate reductase [Armatimonadota bacterium]